MTVIEGLGGSEQLCRITRAFAGHIHKVLIFGPRHEKTCLQGFANNAGAEQPANPRSLISTFVIRLRNVPYLTCARSNFNFLAGLCSEEIGLKTGFLTLRPIFKASVQEFYL